PRTLADVPADRRVAFVAVYDETTPDGAPVHRVVVADIEDPTVFEVVSRPDHYSVSPHLSPDGQQVLFGDRTIGPVSAVQYVRYDLRTGRADTLGHVPPGGEVTRPILVGLGSPVVWERDGRGFYFTNPTPSFSGKQDVLRFRFADGFFERVHDSGSYATTVIGMKGPDSLVVFSVSPEAPEWTPERPAGIFVMSRDGRLARRARNLNLSYAAEERRLTRGFTEPIMNEGRGLVASVWSELKPGTTSDYVVSLAVTDLDGTYFRSYELDSNYLNWHPHWGPGETVLFERQPRGANDWRFHQAMVLDLETGSVRELADPATYGAVGMRMPDAGDY
ncbi:hypothetical protein, partial [Rubrivirga sp.]|uniref:hypothetical protein n=1 Tax=Rubrivirga sp. TaxID=1885344 RepID=UPI003C73C1BA